MKKLIRKAFLLSSLIGVSVCLMAGSRVYANEPAGISIDDNNFPDEDFREYVKEAFDSDGDGKLSKEEAEAVTSISVFYNPNTKSMPTSVKDLTGIGYFTKLESLYLSGMEITTLDLRGNTELTTLDARMCKLKRIDVSKSTKLKTIKCNSNNISKLDVSKNTDLEILQCAGNNISSINLSSNEALKELSIGNNKLTSIDLKNNNNLEVLNISGNEIGSLDVSNLKNIKNLTCLKCNLNSLDVSGLSNLEYLDVEVNNISKLDVTQNPNLNHLAVRWNNLSSLDVTKNTKLNSLTCDYNNISNLDLSNNTLLRWFTCSNCNLTSLDLTNNVNIWFLDCAENKLEELNVSTLTKLNEFYCFDNKLTTLKLNAPNLHIIFCFKNIFESVDLSSVEDKSIDGDYDYPLIWKGGSVTSYYAGTEKLNYYDIVFDRENKILYMGELAKQYPNIPSDKDEDPDNKDNNSDKDQSNDDKTDKDQSNDNNTDKDKSSDKDKSDKKYSNEWVDGKWYSADGSQTYTGTIEWKCNETGWWIEDSVGWYPTDTWQKIDGVWYYFKPDGYMASNEYYGGYWFNADGSWDSKYFIEWKCNSTGWWIEDISGWWPSNYWLKINNNWYYFGSSGYMLTNQYVDGYWLGADGACY